MINYIKNPKRNSGLKIFSLVIKSDESDDYTDEVRSSSKEEASKSFYDRMSLASRPEWSPEELMEYITEE